MAKRKRRRSTRSKKNQEYPGWLWMLFGLSLGLSVAFAVYVKDRQPSPVAPAARPQPASLQDTLVDNGENATSQTGDVESPEKRFTFYDM